MTVNETPTLSISSEMIEIWDTPQTNTIEFQYHFSIDGKDYGQKSLDGSSRQLFLKKVFEIAGDLSNYQSVGNEELIIENKIKQLGESIFKLILPDKLCDYLSSASTTILTIKTNDQDIPWELLHDGQGFLCHRIAIGREIPRANSMLSRLNRRNLNVCLIGNPTNNLPGASDEIAALKNSFSIALERLKKSYGLNTTLKILEKEEASKTNILFSTLLSSDTEWDIIHYAGHASFNANRPDSSSLMLSDGELKAFEVENLSSNPMFFVNACNSGLAIKQNPMMGFGLLKGIAPSFIKGGALGYVGSLWPIKDISAQTMSEQFYNSILYGAGIGEALLEAKKKLLDKNFDPAAVGYILYGNPASKLPLFEPTVTDGPYVNEVGFKRIIQLESEYSALEILLVNDLPWILWRSEDFINWISRIPATESRRIQMQKILFEYHRHFRSLVLNGDKKFIGILNIKTLRTYFRSKNQEAKAELLADMKIFCECPNFTLLLYEGEDEEIEEIEIVSKHKDVYFNLNESVYVFNKQVRFEQSPVNYSLHANYNPSLIKEYADRFYKYYEKVIKQYSSIANEELYTLNKVNNRRINEITLDLLENELRDTRL